MSGLDLPVTPQVPPHNLEAEIAVLGSVLMEVETLDGPAMSLLQPETFYREGHRKIFAAQLDLRARGFTPDLVTIAEELMRAGKLDEVGGMTYLIGIGQQTPTSAHAERYAAIVREKWVLRQLISQCGRMMQTAYEAQMPLEDMLGKAAQIGQGLETRLDRGVYGISKELSDYMDLVHGGGEGVTPLSTGLRDLDDKLGGGLYPKTLNILAARPSMGKSALMLNIAESVGAHLARTGEKGQVAIVSLEMARQSLVARMVATRGRINSDVLRSAARKKRPLDESQSDRVMRAAAFLDPTPIQFLDDAADIDIRLLANKLRRMHRESPLRLVVVDYLQLMSTGQENRQQEVSAVSRALKGLARELNCAFLVLSQLSRKVEERPNHRPMLSDLRESGGIEQDADVIMFIYRDEYYDKETDKQGIAEIIIGKQREGQVGTVEVQFQSTHVGFADLAYVQGGGA